MLALNDEMLDTLQAASLSGVVRVGFAQDFVETVLPQALRRFSSLYPLVRLEVKIDRNASLLGELDAGNLDIALTLEEPKRTGTKLGELPLCSIANPTLPVRPPEPLPLVLFDEPCVFRSCALDALDSAGRSWRIAMTSPSVSGLWAAVDGGLGITVRAKTGAPSHLDFALEDMPPLGMIGVTLHRRRSARAPSIRRFAEIIGELTSSHYNLNQT